MKTPHQKTDRAQEQAVRGHLKVPACYQCRRCTNGCPLTFAMDIYPDRVIQLVNLGQMERVLQCNTIWVCSACETCTTRCPNEVDIAGVMDNLKEMAMDAGIRPSQGSTLAFHEAFLRDIEKRGRIFEGGMMQGYMLRSGEIFRKMRDRSIVEDIRMGLRLLKKGRMPIIPEGIKDKKGLRQLMKRDK